MNQHTHQQKTSKNQRETHTGTLLFLVLITLLVGGIALSMAQPKTQQSNLQADSTAQTDKNDRPNQNMSSVLAVFPQDLPTPSSARMVASSKTDAAGFSQNIVRLETEEPFSELFDQYSSWAENSNFRISNVDQTGSSAAIALGSNNSQLFIAVIDLNDRRRVEYNQVQK